MNVMADHAVFGDWGVLVSKRAAILSMTSETKLIHVRSFQVISRGSAMRIVTVDATKFSFSEGVMIRKAELGGFRRMAFQASFIRLRGRAHFDDSLR